MNPNNTPESLNPQATEPNEAAIEMQAAIVADQIANPEPPAQENLMAETSMSKKGGKGMLVGIILLVLVALGGIGFGVWEMIDKNNQIDTLNNQISSLKKQNTELLDKLSDNVGPEASDDAWSNYSKNLSGIPIIIESIEGDPILGAQKDPNNHLEITATTGSGKTILSSLENVLTIYYLHIGNGSVPYIYAILENGSVYRSEIDIANSTASEFEQVGNYTRIISVVQSGYLRALLTDINGNVFEQN